VIVDGTRYDDDRAQVSEETSAGVNSNLTLDAVELGMQTMRTVTKRPPPPSKTAPGLLRQGRSEAGNWWPIRFDYAMAAHWWLIESKVWPTASTYRRGASG